MFANAGKGQRMAAGTPKQLGHSPLREKHSFGRGQLVDKGAENEEIHVSDCRNMVEGYGTFLKQLRIYVLHSISIFLVIENLE